MRKETKSRLTSIAVLIMMLPACLTGCGKKASSEEGSSASESQATETTVSSEETNSEAVFDTSSEEMIEEIIDDLADAKPYQVIQKAVDNIKTSNADVTGFNALIKVTGVYTPQIEKAVEIPKTDETSSGNTETEYSTKIVDGEQEKIEAYYMLEVMQNGVHLNGMRIINEKVSRLEAYYVPSNTETTVYYQWNNSGEWHKYSSYNEFVIPEYLDAIRDNSKTHFINASFENSNSDDYCIYSKITDDRMKYVSAAIFESLFFSDLYEKPLSGTTAFTISKNAQLKNLSLALEGEKISLQISADCFNFGNVFDVSVPSTVTAAEPFDFTANGNKFWIMDEAETVKESNTSSSEDSNKDASNEKDSSVTDSGSTDKSTDDTTEKE